MLGGRVLVALIILHNVIDIGQVLRIISDGTLTIIVQGLNTPELICATRYQLRAACRLTQAPGVIEGEFLSVL